MSALAATAQRASLDRAYRALFSAVVFAVLAFGVGAGWDRAWHATHPFEDFWSPPHLFIYSTNLVATLLVAWLALWPDLRRHYGDPIRLSLGIQVPPALALALGGFLVIAMAGLFDSVWHSRFGLDETAWSFPHAMLGSGILTSLLGFVSCRLGLADRRPLASWAPALFALVLVSTIVGVLYGPLDNNRTLEEVRAIGRIPVLAADRNFQHVVRLEVAWDLTRSHPLFAPLSAFAVGLALAFARRLVGRTWVLLLVAAIATLLGTDRRQAELFRMAVVPANWLPIPYVAPAPVVALFGRLERLAWFLGGVLYAALVASWWPTAPLSGVIAPFVMLLGAALGLRLHALVARPNANVVPFVLGVGILLPAVTGTLDLFLRARTP